MTDPTTAERVLVWTLLLASTMTAISTTTLSPALPAIERHFADAANVRLLVGLLVSITALCIGLGSPVAGIVADRFGRKRLLLGSIGGTAAAGSSGYVLDSLLALLVSRAVLGLAVAGVIVAATTLITDLFAGECREAVLGSQGAVVFFAGVCFLPLGGALADAGWRLPFLVYLAPLALIPLVIGWVDEPEGSGLNGTNPDPTGSRRGITVRSIGRPALGRLATIYGTIVVAQVIYFTIPVRMPFYLQGVAGVSGTAVGAAIATMLFVGGVVSTRFRAINRRLGVVGVVALHFSVMGIGYAIVTVSAGYAGVVTGLAVTGLGLGLQLPAFNTWAAAVVPDGFRGRALGGLTSALFFGQFVSPILTRPLVETIGLGGTYGVTGAAMVGLAIVLIAMRARLRPTTGRAN